MNFFKVRLFFYFLFMLCFSQLFGSVFKVQQYLELPCAKGKCNVASGLAYARKQDKVILVKDFGYADYAHKKIFAPFTQIHIGSLKKQFIAAAVLRLMAEKKLDLNDPINKYIKFDTTLPAKDPLWIHHTTLHHLLTHVSGVTNTSARAIPTENPLPYLDRIYMKAVSPSLPPKYEYSSVAYRLLEHVIEHVSGMTLSQYFHQYFFAPLEMKNTTLHGPDVPLKLRQAVIKNLSYPYYFSSHKKEVCNAYPADLFRYFGPADMVSTAEDLCKWNSALHSGKVFNTTPKNASKLLNLMRGLYTPDEDGNSYYGYGIKTYFRNGNPVYWHEGLMTGISVYLEYSPHTDTHVVILSNNGDIWFDAKSGEYILSKLLLN